MICTLARSTSKRVHSPCRRRRSRSSLRRRRIQAAPASANPPIVSNVNPRSSLRWYLVPALPRSVGFGPVSSPLRFAHADAVHRGPRPVQQAAPPEPVEHQPVQPLPQPDPLPLAQPSPAGHPRPAAQLPRKRVPADPGAQHEHHPRQHRPARHPRTTGPPSPRWRPGRDQRLDQLPQLIADLPLHTRSARHGSRGSPHAPARSPTNTPRLLKLRLMASGRSRLRPGDPCPRTRRCSCSTPREADPAPGEPGRLPAARIYRTWPAASPRRQRLPSKRRPGWYRWHLCRCRDGARKSAAGSEDATCHRAGMRTPAFVCEACSTPQTSLAPIVYHLKRRFW